MNLIQSVLLLANSFNYQCTHQHVCHPRCFRRQMRACSRMLTSLRKVYGDEPHLEGVDYLAFNKKVRSAGPPLFLSLSRSISSSWQNDPGSGDHLAISLHYLIINGILISRNSIVLYLICDHQCRCR